MAGKAPITVVLHKGVFYLDEPLVFAPAPIPIGQEIEVHLLDVAGTKGVAVRDLMPKGE